MRSTQLAISALLLVLLYGCEKPKDVTNDPTFGNFAAVVGTYKIKVPLRLVQLKDPPQLSLIVGQESYVSTSEQTLPAGTVIRIDKLISTPSFETGGGLDASGHLAVGPQASE